MMQPRVFGCLFTFGLLRAASHRTGSVGHPGVACEGGGGRATFVFDSYIPLNGSLHVRRVPDLRRHPTDIIDGRAVEFAGEAGYEPAS